MGDLSRNLSRHEFSCLCGCGFDTVDVELVRVLQQVCFEFEQRTGERVYIIITGPNRCAHQNSTTPRARKNSQHIYGRAADFRLKTQNGDIPPEHVYNYLDKTFPDRYGLGIYTNRVHLDTRTNGPARWDER